LNPDADYVAVERKNEEVCRVSGAQLMGLGPPVFTGADRA